MLNLNLKCEEIELKCTEINLNNWTNFEHWLILVKIFYYIESIKFEGQCESTYIFLKKSCVEFIWIIVQYIPLPVISIQLPVGCGQFNSKSNTQIEREPILAQLCFPKLIIYDFVNTYFFKYFIKFSSSSSSKKSLALMFKVSFDM